jgi:cellobiose epimerase
MYDSKFLRSEFTQELNRLLSYWEDFSVDNVYGGFVGERDFFNQLKWNANKGIVLNARILFTFSLAYYYCGKQSYLDHAERAFDYLLCHFWDKKYGGFVWEVTYEGEYANMRKQTYAQGFAIYGLAEYYSASGNSEALDLAIRTFELLEERVHDKRRGGYIEALDKDWTRIRDMRMSPSEANEPKSMNAHLHILEAFTRLHSVWNDGLLKERLKELTIIFLERILNRANNHFFLFFDMDWNATSKLISYGHETEASWLICEAAKELADKQLLSLVQKIMAEVLAVNFREGVNHDGSILYLMDPEAGRLDTDLHWWPQAESMVGFYNGYQLTGNVDYRNQAFRCWKIIRTYFIDHDNGEWHWRLNLAGVPYKNEVKLGFWKCPYHNVRALIEMLKRIDFY